MTTGQRIREQRTRAGLSQAQLASAVGVDSNTVSRWERGLYKAAGESVYKLARALGTSVAYLLGETGSPARHTTLLGGDSDVVTGNPPLHEALGGVKTNRANWAGPPHALPADPAEQTRQAGKAEKAEKEGPAGYRSARDLDLLVREMASDDPDFGILIRTALRNWSTLPDDTRRKILQIMKVGLSWADTGSE